MKYLSRGLAQRQQWLMTSGFVLVQLMDRWVSSTIGTEDFRMKGPFWRLQCLSALNLPPDRPFAPAFPNT